MSTLAVSATATTPYLKHLARTSHSRAAHRQWRPRATFCAAASKTVRIGHPAATAADDRAPSQSSEVEDDDETYSVLASMSTQYNDIMVVDTPKSRLLLLDSTHNIHSMLSKDKLWTDSYWDDFASLPAIIPEGPVAILGLGAGTAAHLMLALWPTLQLHGWEIDQILIDIAREYFGLSNLEKYSKDSGSLFVHIGDALSDSATIQGGFAGIIVDLFSDGKVIPQLKEVETWLAIEKKLKQNGRIMINCGGAHTEVFGIDKAAGSISTSSWIQNSTIKALCQAFPGKLCWKKMAERDSDNYLALTGPLPDFDAWSASVPSDLISNVKEWRPCELAP